ncbi:MAG TPA: hypothetical protein VG944_03385 [Fimbriimonas sp.]|nr:hypothetical protein [Fimbriimonas sp.]
MRFIDTLRSSPSSKNQPVTIGIIALVVLGTACAFMFHGLWVLDVLLTNGSFRWPWSFLTYPFFYLNLDSAIGLLWFIFILSWIYWISSSLERDLGAVKFALLWVASSVLVGICLCLGASLVSSPLVGAGPLVPFCSLMVVWAARNQTARVAVFGLVEVNGIMMVPLAALMELVECSGFVGAAGPKYIGLFACLPMFLAYAFARNKLPGIPYAPSAMKPKVSKAQIQKEQSFFDEVRKREQDRAERERLRKLFESSVNDDSDTK